MGLIRVVGFCALLLALQACKTTPPPQATSKELISQEHSLTLLHTNDIHGGIFPRESPLAPKGVKMGGAIFLDQALQAVRREGQATLLLDAGDLMTGSPASEVVYKGVPGGGLFEMFNVMGYDAWTLGNHEFDGRRSDLFQGIASLSMPTLCANLTYDTGHPLSDDVQPYTLIERGDLTIAIAGLITHDLHTVLPLTQLEGLALSSPIDRARELVQLLDPVSDVIVFLTHQGLGADRRLAKAIPDIDVIVGGHSHTRLRNPVKVGNTLIVQAGSDLFHLGRLDLIIEDDRVTSYRGQLLPLTARETPITPSPGVMELVSDIDAKVDALYGRVIADVTIPLTRRHNKESNIGDWMAELLRKSARTQIGIVNSGGIRRDIPQGPLTLRTLKGAMPFDNTLTTFTLSGAELMEVARHNAQVSLNEDQGILQIAGFSYSYVVREGSASIHELKVAGEPVDPDALYSVAGSDYVVFSQPLKSLGLIPRERQRQAQGVFQALASAIEEGQAIRISVDGRIQEHRPQ